MRRSKTVLLAAAVSLAAWFFATPASADDGKTVGRVRVTRLSRSSATSAESVSAALAARNAPGPGTRFPQRRIISVRPRPGDPTRFDATIYDSALEKAFELTLDAKGNEISRHAIAGQP